MHLRYEFALKNRRFPILGVWGCSPQNPQAYLIIVDTVAVFYKKAFFSGETCKFKTSFFLNVTKYTIYD